MCKENCHNKKPERENYTIITRHYPPLETGGLNVSGRHRITFQIKTPHNSYSTNLSSVWIMSSSFFFVNFHLLVSSMYTQRLRRPQFLIIQSVDRWDWKGLMLHQPDNRNELHSGHLFYLLKHSCLVTIKWLLGIYVGWSLWWNMTILALFNFFDQQGV